jgi:hypothetical protein
MNLSGPLNRDKLYLEYIRGSYGALLFMDRLCYKHGTPMGCDIAQNSTPEEYRVYSKRKAFLGSVGAS